MASKRWLLVTAATAALVWACWLLMAPAPWTAVSAHWPVSLTMIFGSFVAGATCEGGGAVAFPVFTKVLQIPPGDAKLFSLAIQSVGMTAASVTIFAMRRRIDVGALLRAGAGGAVGIALGLWLLAPLVPPQVVRVLFTMLQVAFAISLIIVNRRGEQAARGEAADLGDARATWILVGVGLLGGVVSSLFGNGIDLLTFSVLVLLFRVDERIATPTTVVLMASNSLVGFAVGLAGSQYSPLVLSYWTAAIPVVVVGAPLGAIVCRRLARRTIVRALVALIAIELATTLWLIPMTPRLAATAAAALLTFTISYLAMCRCQRFWPAGAESVSGQPTCGFEGSR